jgi:hypothetical protein
MYNVNNVDTLLAEMWIESMKIKQEAAKAPADPVKLPESFKKDYMWCIWKESVITYLHSKIGQVSTPLAYIVREQDISLPKAMYDTVHEQLVNKAILYGAEFNTNNGLSYDLLQSLTPYDPAWSRISAYQQNRESRGAWEALIAYYEDDEMKMPSKQECYDAMSKAAYQGVKHNFDFSTHAVIHQQAQHDLVNLGEPILENKG